MAWSIYLLWMPWPTHATSPIILLHQGANEPRISVLRSLPSFLYNTLALYFYRTTAKNLYLLGTPVLFRTELYRRISEFLTILLFRFVFPHRLIRRSNRLVLLPWATVNLNLCLLHRLLAGQWLAELTEGEALNSLCHSTLALQYFISSYF